MSPARKFHKDGTLPQWDEYFVFGSNLAGVHGAGAALVAARTYGAENGISSGFTGRSYAIPTKNGKFRTLSLNVIHSYVRKFFHDAVLYSMNEFFVTRIGCGLAGYTNAEIAPLFKDAPKNCSFAEEWKPWL